jgi:hypothetical protein
MFRKEAFDSSPSRTAAVCHIRGKNPSFSWSWYVFRLWCAVLMIRKKISKRHGSADSDPYQKVTDQQQCAQLLVKVSILLQLLLLHLKNVKYVHITIWTSAAWKKESFQIFWFRIWIRNVNFGSGLDQDRAKSFGSFRIRFRIRNTVDADPFPAWSISWNLWLILAVLRILDVFLWSLIRIRNTESKTKRTN